MLELKEDSSHPQQHKVMSPYFYFVDEKFKAMTNMTTKLFHAY